MCAEEASEGIDKRFGADIIAGGGRDMDVVLNFKSKLGNNGKVQVEEVLYSPKKRKNVLSFRVGREGS